MKYESSILKRLIDTYGVIGNPRYLSEIIKGFIVRGKELYPQLFTYQSDWLAHIDEFGLTPDYVVSYTGQQIYAPHTKERPVKRAILKGSTKYRDIDTGEFLETFEEGRNLELVSVKMPVLTTSNEDGTKTNILTVNEDVTLRSNGSVYDELDLLTGKLTQRIDEDGEILTQEVVKTVDLAIIDQDGNNVESLHSYKDGYITTSSSQLSPTLSCTIPTSNYFSTPLMKSNTQYTLYFDNEVSSVNVGGNEVTSPTSPMIVTSGSQKNVKFDGEPTNVMLFKGDVRDQTINYFTGSRSIQGFILITNGGIQFGKGGRL